MSSYKLTYFNLMGQAEPTRLLFAQAGVPYEDERIQKGDWPALKQSLTFGQLPVLEVDGKKLSQTRAIERFVTYYTLKYSDVCGEVVLACCKESRFLAKKFGFAGKDEWEQAKVDEYVMSIDDLMNKLQPWLNEKSDTKKVEIFQTLVDTEIGPFIFRYEKILEENGTGLLIGNEITLADLCLFHIFFFFAKLLPGSVKKYAAINAFYTRMNEEPKLKEWLEKRPKTDM